MISIRKSKVSSQPHSARYLVIRNRGADIRLAQDLPLAVSAEELGSIREINDEQFAGLGHDDGRVVGDHLELSGWRFHDKSYLHVFVGFHDFFDASQRQIVFFEGIQAFVVSAALFEDFVESLFEKVHVVHELLVKVTF